MRVNMLAGAGRVPRRQRAAISQAECERYEQAIADAGGIDVHDPRASAHNGHIGFNEPAPRRSLPAPIASRSTSRTRAANALWFDGDLDAVPREALTMGMAHDPAVARSIVLIATGESEDRRGARDDGWRPDAPGCRRRSCSCTRR